MTESLFSGLKVIDCASWIAGPAAATIMSDFGADVIKIEPPGIGDPWRGRGPIPGRTVDYYWQLTSRNKRSLAIDLKHEDGIAALRTQLADRKTALGKLLAAQQALLDSLTAAQQGQVGAGGVGAGGTTTAVYTGPTTTQGEKAVAFAYLQLGKPYVWGATGPGSYDCSGLVQAAWASAGVTIPRVTYTQWAGLPHISASALQPGDLLYYDGQGHVSMYVGDGYIIDAPRTGLTVQKIPMNTDWYAQTFEGAVRP